MTQLIHTVAEMREARRRLPEPMGLVPTMGALHAGHLALVERARAECASVVTTIFVNPTQFGPSEDFAAYPRTLREDMAALSDAGVDAAFVPSAEEMYPPGFDTAVEVGAVARPLEGTARPGHFRGVATVVLKLLLVTQPARVYMGAKDGQQLRVVRHMVADLNVPCDVVAVPTVREADGLALSSRNRYLSAPERRAASVIPRALAQATEAFSAGQRDGEVLRHLVTDTINSEPLARVEYVSVADSDTLEELARVERPAMLSLAVRIGNTRLIDNIVLDPEGVTCD